MRRVALFGEDSFHQDFIESLLQGFSRDYDVAIAIRPYSARGGITRVHHELGEFLRDLENDRDVLPDAIVVATDANCNRYRQRRRSIEAVAARFDRARELILYAIPEPHIERWMLVDPAAFQVVFGKGCTLPALKCKKDLYKKLLRQAIASAGVHAPLGGREFAGEIVQHMDLAHVEGHEPSLGRLLKDLKTLFNRWRQG